jgi:murein DD-endopeptidase MepM/ murein hydrolase activator NlpD
MIEIDHGYGIYTLYGHHSRNLVNVGDRVARGGTIAFLGSTGKSTAPHLHFEIRKNGIPVDPKEYLLN